MSRYLICYKFANNLDYFISEDLKLRIEALQFHVQLSKNVYIVCQNEEKLHELYKDFELKRDDTLIIYDLDKQKIVDLKFNNADIEINKSSNKIMQYLTESCAAIAGEYYNS